MRFKFIFIFVLVQSCFQNAPGAKLQSGEITIFSDCPDAQENGKEIFTVSQSESEIIVSNAVDYGFPNNTFSQKILSKGKFLIISENLDTTCQAYWKRDISSLVFLCKEGNYLICSIVAKLN